MYLFILTSPPLLCSSSSHPSLQAGGQFCRGRGGDVEGEGCRDGGGNEVIQGLASQRCFETNVRSQAKV